MTVVRADGKVLVDSEADAAGMENHRTRPELMQAFRRRSGIGHTAECHDRCVIPLRGGTVPADGAIRIALPLSEINRQVSADPRQDAGEHGAGVSAGDC